MVVGQLPQMLPMTTLEADGQTIEDTYYYDYR
jgi:hypothetical protein